MKLKLMILDKNLITNESNGNEPWEEISNQIDKGYFEVKKAIESNDRISIAKKLINFIQITIKALVLFEEFGIDIRQLFNRHNKKLINIGWREKGIINISIK